MEFERFASQNTVWSYFLRNQNGERAKCETCKSRISCKGGSTGAMQNHLHWKHNIQVNAKGKQQVSSVNTNQNSSGIIEKYFKTTKELLERVVAELAAVDHISFNAIPTSNQLRQAFLARGYTLPRMIQNVRGLIMAFFETLKSNTKKIIGNKKGAKKFCSATMN